MGLQRRRVLLAITGGIAAYKALELARLLLKNGAELRVIMTRGALAFITPLTVQALTGREPHIDLLDDKAEAGMGHIELARWCDVLVVAPASANSIARLANGFADDLLTTVALACKSISVVVPAMNEQMWAKQNVQENIANLCQKNWKIWGPNKGEQACGDSGFGRMIEADTIQKNIVSLFDKGLLQGKKVVVNGGPTREKIDPVRYVSNFSSGKMAYAIAQAAVLEGAEVVLISGPVNIPPPDYVRFVEVESAQEMLEQSLLHTCDCDIFVAAAAVADYRVKQYSGQKMKKNHCDTMTLELEKTPDILRQVATKLADAKTLVVGFAAETQNIIEYAQQKLVAKGADIIIANDVSGPDIGFNSDYNAVYLVQPKKVEQLERISKKDLGIRLIKFLAQHLK